MQITVPNLQGHDRSAAAEALTGVGLVVGNVGERESTEPRGTVVAQEPAAGVAVGAGAPVAFWLAMPAPTPNVPTVTPPPTVTVPDVGGRTVTEAVRLIAEGRLTLGNVGNAESSTGTPGTVIAQQPLPGQAVAPGTSVNLVMATARPTTTEVWPPPTWVYPWLLAGALLGLTVAGAGSLAKSRQQQRAPSSTELAPHVDHGIQVTVPDDETAADFEVSLEGRADQGVQSIEDEGDSNTGMAGHQVTSW